MRGYYLFAPVEPGCAGPESGVERKVRAQHKALQQYLDCELVILPPVEYSGSLSEKIIRRLPFTAAWRKWEYHGEFNDADFLYIRQVYHDASFARFLRAIKKQNPKIKILYEVPTYPYEILQKGVKIRISNISYILKELFGRALASQYMDRVISFYGQESIFGVPCIQLINGFDFSAVHLPDRKNTGTVHLISVAATAPWHGYDRVLSGIADYYENGGREKIVYHFVGEPLPEHIAYTAEQGIEEHVVFHGKLSGDALRAVFENCLLGIDVLGGHRKDYPVSSSLKSREYAAYGLPIITSSPVDYLPKDYPYQFVATYDDSPLDFEAVLRFFHSIYDATDCMTVARSIRRFGEEKTDMNVTMKAVIDWLLE